MAAHPIRPQRDALPWRAREAEAKAVEGQRKLDLVKAVEAVEADRRKAKENSFFESQVRSKIVPALLAVVAFLSGQLVEQFRQGDSDERLAVSNRRKLFEATSQDFGIFLTQWNRLMLVSPAQASYLGMIETMESELRRHERIRDGSGLPTEAEHSLKARIARHKDESTLMTTRKERYLKSRDDAKDRLSGNFEQARLFFRKQTVDAITDYEAFERGLAQNAAAQPSIEEWRHRATQVFQHMRSEIQDDELRLKPVLFRVLGR